MKTSYIFIALSSLCLLVGTFELHEAEAQAQRTVLCLRPDGETVVAKRRCLPRRGESRLSFSDLKGNQGEQGIQGEEGPQGEQGSQGETGADGSVGNSVVLCWGTINMDTDTVISFGGNGTTNVTTAPGAFAARKINTCIGSYPGITAESLTVLATMQGTNASISMGVGIGTVSADSSEIEIETISGDSDEIISFVVFGETS